jgi:hypothetical protein
MGRRRLAKAIQAGREMGRQWSQREGRCQSELGRVGRQPCNVHGLGAVKKREHEKGRHRRRTGRACEARAARGRMRLATREGKAR